MLKAFMASCAGFVSAATNSTTNGITFSADTSVIQQAEEAYWAAIQNRLNNINVPDLILPKDTEDYLKDNKFTIAENP